LPGPQGTHAGFIHEFIHHRDADQRFYLYVQTNVGQAPLQILDDILASLQGGLPEDEDPGDWTVEGTGPRRRLAEEVGASLQQVTQSVQASVPFKAVGEGIQAVSNLGPAVNSLLDQVDAKVAKSWRAAKRWFKGR
jgi:hypothetical protein